MVGERRVDRHLVGAVAVEHARRGEVQAAAVHDGDRHPRPVIGGGPFAVGGVAGGVEVAQDGLLLQQRLHPVGQADLQHARGRHHGGAPDAQRGRVGLGVGTEPGRRRAVDGGDDPGGGQRVGAEGVRSGVGQGQDAHLCLRVGALAQHEGAGEGVDVLDPHPGAVGDDLAPGVGTRGGARRGVRGGQDTEVLGVLVGQRHEPAGAAEGRGEVVEGVFDPLAPGHDHGRGREGLVGGESQPLGRVGAVQADEHEGLVAGRAGAEGEAAVLLLVDERVLIRVAAQAVAPELVRAQGVIEPDVEDLLAVSGPGQPVADLGHHLGRHGGRGLGVEGLEAQLVALVAGAVGRVGQPEMVAADGGAPHGEVLRAGGQGVLVQQDLLLVAGLARRGQLVGAAGGPAAVDGVVLPLLGPRVVPPRSPAGRDGHVRLLDPRLHLLEELVLQRTERGQDLVGVGVLGLQVGQDLGVLAVAEPVPGVLALVPVGDDDVGALGGLGRGGHGREPATPGDTEVAPSRRFGRPGQLLLST